MSCREQEDVKDCLSTKDLTESKTYIAKLLDVYGPEDESEYICSLLNEVCGDQTVCDRPCRKKSFEKVKNYFERFGISKLLYERNLAIPKHRIRLAHKKEELSKPYCQEKLKEKCTNSKSLKQYRECLKYMPFDMLVKYDKIMSQKPEELDIKEAKNYLKKLNIMKFKTPKRVEEDTHKCDIRPLPWNDKNKTICEVCKPFKSVLKKKDPANPCWSEKEKELEKEKEGKKINKCAIRKWGKKHKEYCDKCTKAEKKGFCHKCDPHPASSCTKLVKKKERKNSHRIDKTPSTTAKARVCFS